MIVVRELKLNKFRKVAIPSPKEYAQRFGLNSSNLPSSGDEVAPMPERKLDTLNRMASENDRQLAKESRSTHKQSQVKQSESTPTEPKSE